MCYSDLLSQREYRTVYCSPIPVPDLRDRFYKAPNINCLGTNTKKNIQKSWKKKINIQKEELYFIDDIGSK